MFTELLSKREAAESALRKDMFSTILKEFFAARDQEKDGEDISKGLLKLEIVALNFGESLSLNPLFIEIDNDIDAISESDSQLAFLDRDMYRSRLHSLARQGSGGQIATLAAG